VDQKMIIAAAADIKPKKKTRKTAFSICSAATDGGGNNISLCRFQHLAGVKADTFHKLRVTLPLAEDDCAISPFLAPIKLPID